ncbi:MULTISPECIES: DUF3892 domain-containing protein [Parageobacillus]|jgi:Protein of unknown function (DUF3892)|uniref:DUF3892 domain-containing protein n=1 Tax=Parageobacillus thermoglucosidasius TaxID=1426 RepID=A0A1B7KM67_PARTM|nr:MULTISPECIES: DUF3892 domain-containing protein [Parageobacillus]OAT71192.1 hypothetical protein A7K69_15500 [Parageobacillus thermoglucosidasius]BDG47442.1 hypothetical protein PspKH34_20030 [Parageobacillus sp. KH3-4]
MNGQETFVAVQKNHQGDIIGFKTSKGRILSYRRALMEVEKGAIAGVHVVTEHDGERYIRSNPDGDPSNNLDQLPPFS